MIQEITPVLAELGYNRYECKEIIRAMTQIDCTIRLRDWRKNKLKTSKKHYIMKALLKGTVFSGHPSRTTWGNTIRILYYNYALAAKYGYLEGYHCFVAGDDVLEIIES